ncbi:helix-turn-helix domain-containing protein [Mesorhizobium sp. Pch-S]|uniref:winged helix-turn-helix transcriptional regulator n=2 Tax=Pseudomonadati TaxID=3379134 RepID=UPI001A92B6D5|nr:helix-turn-helix domain-containing protein [Mesorhizobium sp. Pch-S]
MDFPTYSLHSEFENTTLIWFDFQTLRRLSFGMLSIPPSEVPRHCNIADALEVVGDRWSLLVVRELFYGPQRFTDIARHTGAPRDILAVRLRKLEEHGVLTRVPYSEHPPRYEYRLTPSGRALSPVLLTLKRWGRENLGGGADPFVLRHSCGAEFVAQVHCKACGEVLPPDASDAGKLFVADFHRD